MNEERDTDARLWHPWLRINRVLRVMLHTRWRAEAWSLVRVEFRRALALRSEIRTRGLVQPAVLDQRGLTLFDVLYPFFQKHQYCCETRRRRRGRPRLHDVYVYGDHRTAHNYFRCSASTPFFRVIIAWTRFSQYLIANSC